MTPEAEKLVNEIAVAQRIVVSLERALEVLRQHGVGAENDVISARSRVKELQARLAAEVAEKKP